MESYRFVSFLLRKESKVKLYEKERQRGLRKEKNIAQRERDIGNMVSCEGFYKKEGKNMIVRGEKDDEDEETDI